MYYEEKIIDGILCWRNKPDGDFKPCTLEELSAEVVRLKKENKILESKIEKIKEIINASRS